MQMPLAVGQAPFTMAAAAPPPDRPAPHDFFMLALVTTIICAILNLLSLAFGIPATVLAALVCNYYLLCILYSWKIWQFGSLSL